MAFLDFLNNDVGGYAAGPMPSGAAGVPQSGITYNDIMKAMLANGSKPGSSGPMFAGGIPGAATQQPVGGIQPLTPEKKDSGISNSLIKGLMAYFLGGA